MGFPCEVAGEEVTCTDNLQHGNAFNFEGLEWQSVEAAFQAAKYKSAEKREQIRACKSGLEAAFAGQERLPIRPDWDGVRHVIMYRAARVKYHQNPDLAKQLLDTGNKEITHNDDDPFWAKWNALVQMRCREELKPKDERNMERLSDIIKQFDDEVKRFYKKKRIEIEPLPGDIEMEAASSLTKSEVDLCCKSRITHHFRYDAAWGESLTSQAPASTRVSSQRSRQIVTENDEVVKAGCFEREEDGREVQLNQPPPTERFTVPAYPVAMKSCRFGTTKVCVANIDTESAALLLPGSLALNFANAYVAGGHYRAGARAQEEDLCRLLPQLIHSLEACDYPIEPSEALVTRKLQAVRKPGTYQFCDILGEVDIVTAAMPSGDAGCPESETWNNTVTMRMRSVLHAAKHGGYKDLVLGAWGCGVFGNPPGKVATLFREQLVSPEFRGAFEHIVFAVLDPAGDGNLDPFMQEIAKIGEQEPKSSGKKTREAKQKAVEEAEEKLKIAEEAAAAAAEAADKAKAKATEKEKVAKKAATDRDNVAKLARQARKEAEVEEVTPSTKKRPSSDEVKEGGSASSMKKPSKATKSR